MTCLHADHLHALNSLYHHLTSCLFFDEALFYLSNCLDPESWDGGKYATKCSIGEQNMPDYPAGNSEYLSDEDE